VGLRGHATSAILPFPDNDRCHVLINQGDSAMTPSMLSAELAHARQTDLRRHADQARLMFIGFLLCWSCRPFGGGWYLD
jgi:hypothetical protein